MVVGVVLGQIVRVLGLVLGQVHFLVFGEFQLHLAPSQFLVVEIFERDAGLGWRCELDKGRVAFLV